MRFMDIAERVGRERGLLKGIEVALKIKFGPAALDLMPEIRELHDHELLETVLRAILTATSPDKLRRVWTRKRRPKKARRRKKAVDTSAARAVASPRRPRNLLAVRLPRAYHRRQVAALPR